MNLIFTYIETFEIISFCVRNAKNWNCSRNCQRILTIHSSNGNDL